MVVILKRRNGKTVTTKPNKKRGRKKGRSRTTDRQKVYADEFMKDLDMRGAYKRAGYKGGEEGAYSVHYNKNVQILLKEKMKAREERTDITVDRVLAEEACIALSNPKDFILENGTIKDIHSLTDEQARAISSLSVTELPNGFTRTIIKFWNKGQSLERVGKHLGMFVDVVKVNVKIKAGVMVVPGVAKSIEEWADAYKTYNEAKGIEDAKPVGETIARQ